MRKTSFEFQLTIRDSMLALRQATTISTEMFQGQQSISKYSRFGQAHHSCHEIVEIKELFVCSIGQSEIGYKVFKRISTDNNLSESIHIHKTRNPC